MRGIKKKTMDNKEKITSEPNKLDMSNVSCRLYDLMSINPDSFHIYTEPIYTKLNSMYGYISVSGEKVFFFWNNDGEMCFDDISHMFKVEYVVKNSVELLKEITRLQEKYDENGYDCSPIVKLQRIEQHIDTALKIWEDNNNKS